MTGGADIGAYRQAVQADPCAYCGGPADTLDHIDPVGCGGRNHWPNLTASCRRCNQQKGTKSLLAFLLARPLFAQRDEINAELRRLTAA